MFYPKIVSSILVVFSLTHLISHVDCLSYASSRTTPRVSQTTTISLPPEPQTSFIVTVSALTDHSRYSISSFSAYSYATDHCPSLALSCLGSGPAISPFPRSRVSVVPGLANQSTISTDATLSTIPIQTLSNLTASSSTSTPGPVPTATPPSSPTITDTPLPPSSPTITDTPLPPSSPTVTDTPLPPSSPTDIPTPAQPVPSLIDPSPSPATITTPSPPSYPSSPPPVTSQHGDTTETLATIPPSTPSDPPGQIAYVITIQSTTLSINLVPITELQSINLMITLEIAVGPVTTAFSNSIVFQDTPIAFSASDVTLSDSFPTRDSRITTALAPSSSSTVTSPLVPLLTLGTSTYTTSSNAEYVIGGQTLRPGSSAIEVSGIPLSLDPQETALVIGGSTTIAETLGLGGYIVSGFQGNSQSTSMGAPTSNCAASVAGAVPFPSSGGSPADPLSSILWMGAGMLMVIVALLCA